MQRVRDLIKNDKEKVMNNQLIKPTIFPLINSLLIPLNKCRRDTLYAPWKCEDER